MANAEAPEEPLPQDAQVQAAPEAGSTPQEQDRSIPQSHAKFYTLQEMPVALSGLESRSSTKKTLLIERPLTEKPYQCPLCKEKMTLKNALRQHLRKRHSSATQTRDEVEGLVDIRVAKPCR